jgi:hypothetical protein
MLRKLKLMVLLALLTGWSAQLHAAQKKALSVQDLLQLLAGGVYDARITQLVQDRGITFVPTSHDLNLLRSAGANLALLNAVESARHVTAQVPEQRNPHFERQLIIPPVGPVESNPHNTLNLPPPASGVPQAVPVTPPKVRTQLPVPGPTAEACA